MPETNTSFHLDGKVVLLCGGSGPLGSALAKAIEDAGARLVVASRSASREAPAVREHVTLDLSVEASILSACNRIVARSGRIDGLVFNAVSRPMRGLDDELAKWEKSMLVNAKGFFALCRTIGDVMVSQHGGSIVNIGSIHGMVGSQPWLYEGTEMAALPDYHFHKGGMLNLTRYFASVYGPAGVRVNSVSPGGILKAENPPPSTFVERYAVMTMLGRMAQPHEIGGAVVFLLSDAASYITGVNLPVDGGYSAK